jgi:hypothetical protein
MKKKISKVSWVLAADVLAELRGCQDCKENPAVFLTAKKVRCCRVHWEKLADDQDITSELEVPLLVKEVGPDRVYLVDTKEGAK